MSLIYITIFYRIERDSKLCVLRYFCQCRGFLLRNTYKPWSCRNFKEKVDILYVKKQRRGNCYPIHGTAWLTDREKGRAGGWGGRHLRYIRWKLTFFLLVKFTMKSNKLVHLWGRCSDMRVLFHFFLFTILVKKNTPPLFIKNSQFVL